MSGDDVAGKNAVQGDDEHPRNVQCTTAHSLVARGVAAKDAVEDFDPWGDINDLRDSGFSQESSCRAKACSDLLVMQDIFDEVDGEMGSDSDVMFNASIGCGVDVELAKPVVLTRFYSSQLVQIALTVCVGLFFGAVIIAAQEILTVIGWLTVPDLMTAMWEYGFRREPLGISMFIGDGG